MNSTGEVILWSALVFILPISVMVYKQSILVRQEKRLLKKIKEERKKFDRSIDSTKWPPKKK